MAEQFKGQDEPLRIGAVSYLNTKPLVYGLQDIVPSSQLTFDYPSCLADSLAAGELDVALVPSIELATHSEWSIVSDACIGCLGPVLSVKLLFRVPPEQVKTLALDEGSRTSIALSKILLHELYGIRPKVSPLPLGSDPKDSTADAILVIGDRAIRGSIPDVVESWDLGDRWCRWSELPFVFAMWVARPRVDVVPLARALSQARDQGVERFQEIAEIASQEMELPRSLVEEYLCQNLYYWLGSQQLRGLELYYRKAFELGLINNLPRIKIDDCQVEHI